jgi:hypothetical protein
MVKPLSLEGRADRTRVEGRACNGSRWAPGAAFETEPPNYRSRAAARRSSMRAHPSAQRRADPGEPPRS